LGCCPTAGQSCCTQDDCKLPCRPTKHGFAPLRPNGAFYQKLLSVGIVVLGLAAPVWMTFRTKDCSYAPRSRELTAMVDKLPPLPANRCTMQKRARLVHRTTTAQSRPLDRR
jgi:hypothetical protein